MPRGMTGRDSAIRGARGGSMRWPVVILAPTGANEYGANSTKWRQFAPVDVDQDQGPMPKWGGNITPSPSVMTGWGGMDGVQSYPQRYLMAAREALSGTESIEAETLEQNVTVTQWRMQFINGVTTDMRVRDITNPADPVDYQIQASVDVDGLRRQLALKTIRLHEVSQVVA